MAGNFICTSRALDAHVFFIACNNGPVNRIYRRMDRRMDRRYGQLNGCREYR